MTWPQIASRPKRGFAPAVSRRSRGFTLIEVLLAGALLALGVLLAFSTVRTATGSVTRAEHAAARQERLRAVQAFLRRQLSSAQALPYARDKTSGNITVFEGTAEQVTFVAAMPGYLSRGGPYQQILRLSRDSAGYRLEFEHRMMLGQQVIEPNGKLMPEVLMEGIDDAAFEFRTLDTDGQPSDWSSSWDMPGRLPLLLRLRLRFTDPRARWPDLEIPLRLTAVGGYALDGVTSERTQE